MKTSRAPCSICLGETEHTVLHFVDRRTTALDWTFTLLECAGCKHIVLREVMHFGDHENNVIRYYPSPASRKVPDWVFEMSFGWVGGQSAISLSELLEEIYQAVRGGQFRLAIMGVRALIEQVMIQKIGDNGSFVKNLDAFQQAGYISLVQRDALNDILDAGHATIHRAYEPKAKDIDIALDISEGIMAAIYVHGDAAKKLSARVPARPKKPNS
jgi:Domain of unknown function (DUF4145)